MSATHTPLPSLETTCIKRGTPPPQHALDEATHDRDSPSNPQSRWEEPSGVEVGDEEPDHAVAMAGLLEIGNQGGWILKTAELEIGRQIGLGSVGAVYKGKHIASGKTVAVKVVRDDLMLRTREGNRILEDLACEIDQLAKIGPHPNIVGFVGANIDASAEPVIVLEYMDGGCLQDVLAAKSKNGRSWRPPKETSISWLISISVLINGFCATKIVTRLAFV
ncbi:kinase-like domain-containing protein [Baffinella frigidus]|nr:kinase-like domain-containing protein [Cryptophyta sp. CCMP2293]